MTRSVSIYSFTFLDLCQDSQEKQLRKKSHDVSTSLLTSGWRIPNSIHRRYITKTYFRGSGFQTLPTQSKIQAEAWTPHISHPWLTNFLSHLKCMEILC